jgi:serine/threonine protein kinase
MSVQNGQLSSIDARYKRWKSFVSVPFQSLAQGADIDFCPSIHLSLSTRIGSDSSNGEVYVYKPPLGFILCALKIIPITPVNERFGIQELLRSQQLSNTKLPFYPKMFAMGRCAVRGMHESTKFGKTEEVLYGVYELLDMNVNQKLEHANHNQVEKVACIQQLIPALYDLNYNQHIAHNDLHLSNVMYRADHTIVIIDVGSATAFKDTHDDYSDLIFFCKSLLIKLPQEWLHKFITYLETLQEQDKPYNVRKLQQLLQRLVKQ